MSRRLDASAPGFAQAYAALIADRGAQMDAAEEAVRPILTAVRERGLAAVLEATARFDGLRQTMDDVVVSADERARIAGLCPPDLFRALEHAAARIRVYHERARPRDELWTDAEGLTLGWRWSPVDAAGLYAPGGLAAYPSAVLMNAIPAKVAGVKRLVMATPPARLAENPAILAAAQIAGVDEVWAIGGAQAIAALAYGADPLLRCDVVAGPGNAYVAAAKKLVFGDVGVDSIAGPSEVFILADDSADPEWLAADLLAQAEHGEDSQSVLFTVDHALADAVAAAVGVLIAQGKAGPAAAASWRDFGAIVVAPDMETACDLMNEAAAEHVQVATRDPERWGARITHAGALFLGALTPEALGDYNAGPNHVLPTGRRARFASGLSTMTFMKRTTLLSASAYGLEAIGANAAAIADAEGLPAHAHSVRSRLKRRGAGGET
jgi:histidinol dehydrogenase